MHLYNTHAQTCPSERISAKLRELLIEDYLTASTCTNVYTLRMSMYECVYTAAQWLAGKSIETR